MRTKLVFSLGSALSFALSLSAATVFSVSKAEAAAAPFTTLKDIKPAEISTSQAIKTTCERIEATRAKAEQDLQAHERKLRRFEIKTYQSIGLKVQAAGVITSRFVQDYFSEEVTTLAQSVLPLAESLIRLRREAIINGIPKLISEADLRTQDLEAEKSEAARARVRLFALQQCGVPALLTDTTGMGKDARLHYLRDMAIIQTTLFPRVKRLEDGTTGLPCQTRLEKLKERLKDLNSREFADQVLTSIREEANRSHAFTVRNAENLGRFVEEVLKTTKGDTADVVHATTLHSSLEALDKFRLVMQAHAPEIAQLDLMRARAQELSDTDSEASRLKGELSMQYRLLNGSAPSKEDPCYRF